MLARFFIDRPVFAWVISIVIVLIGGLCYFTRPIAQYPEITPPTVSVTCQYPGADAKVVADTVAAPIEQQVNGVENALYMSSQCTNDGSYSLTVTFELGTNLDIAQVLVQNRVAIATPTLPDVVKNVGVVTKKKSPSILLVVNLYSENKPDTEDPYYDSLFLSNYATIYVKDELARLKGVGDVTYLGQQDYSMRVWVDPDKLASRFLSAGDVVKVLREQNVQVAAGQVGQQPVPRGLDFQFTMTTKGRLVEPEEFARIVLRTGADGQVTYVGDVARIELGAKNQDVRNRLDGKPSIGVAVFQLPGSNALAVANLVRAKMRELRERNNWPAHVEYAIVYDTTPFIKQSVDEVKHTLRDAFVLVALVVLVFLQDWKSLILPLIDVGVSLVGTFAVMAMLGFSLNNLTLFGLVLAIGIVVDDAIVVLENIERWLAKGLPVREATIKAMDEITGPIIAITLVLSSVFLPSAFLAGITGQFYRQFALTIAASMIISAINAMTMTPARAASIFGTRKVTAHGEHEGREALPWWSLALLGAYVSYRLLDPVLAAFFHVDELESLFGGGGPTPGMIAGSLATLVRVALGVPGAVVGGFLGLLVIKPVNLVLGVAFGAFNKVFDWLTAAYGRVVGWGLRLSVIVLLVYVGLIGLTYYGFTRLPSGFIPPQDKGYLVVNIQLPDSASLERTIDVVKKVEKIAKADPGVAHTVAVPGQSVVLNFAVSSNFGSMFLVLKPFDERVNPGPSGESLSGEAVAQRIRQRVFAEIEEARVNVFGAPPVDGLGTAGGFKLMVQAIGDVDYQKLQGQADNLAAKGNEVGAREHTLVGLFNSFRATTPQLYVNIDRAKCKAMGVSLSDVFDTLQVYMGGYYVNDFNQFGRTWQVNVQADAPFRINAERVKQMKVRNANGDMVPLGSVADIVDSIGPVIVTRYNMYTAAPINGATLPGVSTGTAISTMEGLAKQELAPGMGYEWTELTYLQLLESRVESIDDLLRNPFTAFAGAVVLVFLVLAAQYESWSLPLAVILVVPMCLLCAIVGVALARMDVNIFVQVGFVVLVGLAAKNAILIVEFARDRQMEGASRFEATVEACKTRLRPIIMTSFAFILGVFPLVIANGAGAEMRRTLGTAVFSGMIGVTLFGIFLTPVFYYVIIGLVGGPPGAKAATHESDHGAAAGRANGAPPAPAAVTGSSDHVTRTPPGLG